MSLWLQVNIRLCAHTLIVPHTKLYMQQLAANRLDRLMKQVLEHSELLWTPCHHVLGSQRLQQLISS